jgi:hypothetical protein
MAPPSITVSMLNPQLFCGKSEKLNAEKTAYCIPVEYKCKIYSNNVVNPVFSGDIDSAT